MHDPDGERLAFIQGKGGASRGPKRDSTNKGKIECWLCGGAHYKNEFVQNLNVDDCDEEHNLFSAGDGYGLVQKQAEGL